MKIMIDIPDKLHTEDATWFLKMLDELIDAFKGVIPEDCRPMYRILIEQIDFKKGVKSSKKDLTQ